MAQIKPLWCVAIALSLLLASANADTDATSWRCSIPPTEACFEHHGRLSSQNGTPLALWLIGTNRRLRIDNDFNVGMPSVVSKYLNMPSINYSYIYGDFQVCPLEPDRPGYQRSACIIGAKNLVVENLGGGRPPFRLMSTWSSRPARRQPR